MTFMTPWLTLRPTCARRRSCWRPRPRRRRRRCWLPSAAGSSPRRRAGPPSRPASAGDRRTRGNPGNKQIMMKLMIEEVDRYVFSLLYFALHCTSFTWALGVNSTEFRQTFQRDFQWSFASTVGYPVVPVCTGKTLLKSLLKFY